MTLGQQLPGGKEEGERVISMEPLPRQNEPRECFHVTYRKGNKGTSMIKRAKGDWVVGGFENLAEGHIIFPKQATK